MAPSHLEITLLIQTTANIIVTATINTRLNDKSSVILSGPKKLLMPTTAKVLNMLDPSTLPTAMACLPLRTALILTTTSGRLVPRAIAPSDMSPGLTSSDVAIRVRESMVYTAPK